LDARSTVNVTKDDGDFIAAPQNSEMLMEYVRLDD